MVISQDASEVFEWDEDLGRLVETALTGDGGLNGFQALGVTANALNC